MDLDPKVFVAGDRHFRNGEIIGLTFSEEVVSADPKPPLGSFQQLSVLTSQSQDLPRSFASPPCETATFQILPRQNPISEVLEQSTSRPVSAATTDAIPLPVFKTSPAAPKKASPKKVSPRKTGPKAVAIAPLSTRKRKAIKDDDVTFLPVAKRQMSTGKAGPCGRPPVWSNRRQELCETVPYYKSYEASWYHPEGKVKAMYITEDSNPRSLADIDVIITRATGGLKKDPKNKTMMIQGKSHKETDLTVRAIQKARVSQAATILIGSGKCDMPVVLPYNFQVLEHYWITDCWWEKVGAFQVFKYRFERCDLSQQPWYQPSNRDFQEPDYSTICHVQSCGKCNEEHPQVYQVWLCLNHNCAAFWKTPTGDDADKSDLIFNPDFVNKRTRFTGTKEYNILPENFDPSKYEARQAAYSRGGWQGFLCDKCGKCSSREDWTGWQCLCGNKHSIEAPVLLAEETNVDFKEDYTLIHLPSKSVTSKIAPQQATEGKYKVNMYEVMDDQWIIHLQSTPELNAQPNGPDQLFKEMQEAKGMKLLRRINGNMQETTSRAALTRHFAQNYGLHYNYVVIQGSTPFSSAPTPVCHALQRLNWAGGATKMDISKPFNELLVVGYMSDGRMGYHDDGEVSLGPTISTLSLGSQAVMKFRYKTKYYDPPLNFEIDKFKAEEVVLPGVPLEAERKSLLAWQQANPNATPAQQKAYFEHLPAIKKQAATKKNPAHRDLVQLLLKHGDMVIMHGAQLQKYMQHQVEARGCLRYALTCRHVLPNMVNAEDLHMGDIDLSTFPEYDGTKDCMETEQNGK